MLNRMTEEELLRYSKIDNLINKRNELRKKFPENN